MSRRLVERYWQAQDPYDPATLATLRHAAWSADWPQSAEKIPSHDADVAIHQSYPGYPAHRLERSSGSEEAWRPVAAPVMFIPVRITGASDFWILEAHLEYPNDGLWHAVALIELRGGLAWRETVYYCRSFESPPWPDSISEQGLGTRQSIGSSIEHNSEAERRHRAAYERFVELASEGPQVATRALFHDDAVVDRPQSGRRATGVERIANAFDTQRVVLPGQIRRLVTSGDILLAESSLAHGDERWFLVTIAEFDGEKVARATEYLAKTYPGPDWRTPWVERLVVS